MKQKKCSQFAVYIHTVSIFYKYGLFRDLTILKINISYQITTLFNKYQSQIYLCFLII